MQCAWAILSSVACPALQYSSTLSHKRYDFRNKVTEHKMYVLIFSATFVWNTYHSKKNWAKCNKKMCIFHVKYPLLLSHFNGTCIFSTVFRKTLEYQLPRSVQWKTTCSMRTDGRTNMMKLIVAIRNFANAPKKGSREKLHTDGGASKWI